MFQWIKFFQISEQVILEDVGGEIQVFNCI
jgi:hypothetical protein